VREGEKIPIVAQSVTTKWEGAGEEGSEILLILLPTGEGRGEQRMCWGGNKNWENSQREGGVNEFRKGNLTRGHM